MIKINKYILDVKKQEFGQKSSLNSFEKYKMSHFVGQKYAFLANTSKFLKYKHEISTKNFD